MPKEDNIKDRLDKAREAMGGEDRAKKKKKAAEELATKRVKARLAMETYEYRHRREEREKSLAETTIRQKKLAEDIARKKAEQEKQRLAELAADQASTEERERLRQTKVMKLKEVAGEIEEMKKDPHIMVNSLRTLKTDVVRAVEEDHLSMAQMAIRERERKLLFEQKEVGQGGSVKKVIGLVAVIAVLVGITLTVWYNLPSLTSNVQSPEPMIPSIIFAESHREVRIGSRERDAQISYLRVIRDSATTSKEIITDIYFTKADSPEKKILGLRAVLDALAIKIPENIIQFSDDNFMLGVHRGSSKSFFLILKTRFYENIAYTLNQEEHTLANVLVPIFTTYAVPPDLQGKPFKDEVIKNTDVRILRKATGAPLLLYGFVDRNTLVIAENEEAFAKVRESYLTPSAVVQ